MCGIIGAITRDQTLKYRAYKVLEKNNYRGPDATCLKVFEQCQYRKDVVLGFNRLAIQDLSNDANQPYVRNNIAVMFNGEIYNHMLLRESVPDYNFETSSDVEIIVALYEKYGINFVKYLNGMFAICLVDFSVKKIYLMRDRIGIKPLYLFTSEETICFASNVTAIVSLINLKPNYNMRYFYRNMILDPFVGFGNLTPFKDIVSLEPATIYLVDLNDFSIETLQYYSIPVNNEEVISIQMLQEYFQNSIDLQLKADVPIGCALSGGIDSSLISVFCKKKLEKLKMFTLVSKQAYSDSVFSDDEYYSKMMVKHLNIEEKDWIPIPIKSHWTIQEIDQIVNCLGSPIYDERALVWDNLYKQVKEHGITVFINGQGADEIWYGYYPKIWNWFSLLYHCPLNARTIESYFISMRSQSALKDIIQIPIELEKEMILEVTGRILSQEGVDDQQKLSLFMMKTVLPGLLFFEDALSMKNAVEVRVPFIDHRMINLSFSTSGKNHIARSSLGKGYLREAFKNQLPNEILTRQKAPLPKPENDKSLQNIFEENLSEIQNDKLVQTLYNTVNFPNLLHQTANGFYGGVNEALLQIISTWRFSKIYNA